MYLGYDFEFFGYFSLEFWVFSVLIFDTESHGFLPFAVDIYVKPEHFSVQVPYLAQNTVAEAGYPIEFLDGVVEAHDWLSYIVIISQQA